MLKSFRDKLLDIFFHRPTESELMYSKTRSMLLDSESWVGRDPIAEATFLALAAATITKRISSLNTLEPQISSIVEPIKKSVELQ